jgi:hypothetical protein
MIQKIKIWITEMSVLTKAVMVFVPVIVGAAKLIAIHDTNILSKSKEQQERDKTLLKSVAVQVDSINKQLTRHTQAQVISSANVNNKLDEVAEKQDKLRKLVTTEFAKSMTPAQVLDMMNSFEKKNSDYNSQLIPYSKGMSR